MQVVRVCTVKSTKKSRVVCFLPLVGTKYRMVVENALQSVLGSKFRIYS